MFNRKFIIVGDIVLYTLFCRALAIEMKWDLSIVVVERPSRGYMAIISIIERPWKPRRGVTFQPGSLGPGMVMYTIFRPERSAHQAFNYQCVIL